MRARVCVFVCGYVGLRMWLFDVLIFVCMPACVFVICACACVSVGMYVCLCGVCRACHVGVVACVPMLLCACLCVRL